jgi:hypothetical protein
VSETALLDEISGTAWSVALAVLPLAALFTLFQVLFLKLPGKEVYRVLAGTLLASAGLFLFLLGVSIAFVPFGRSLGEALGSLSETWLLLPFGALLGFVTTWGEPAVRVLADQVEEASSGSIRSASVLYAVCIGVAVAVAIGLFRIGHGIALLWLLAPGYALVLAIMWASDREFVSIAIDAGGVGTGPLANTFLLALALGASAAAGGEEPLVHGLGLVSLIALAPVISVMVLGLLIGWKVRQKKEP